MLDIGLWGRGSVNLDAFVQQNRRMEHKLTELGGRKVLYSQTYDTEAEFWSLYDWKWYDGLRDRYFASGLLTVYDKVKVDVAKHKQAQASWAQRMVSMWPLAGLRGIRKSIQSKDYLLHRQAAWRYKGKAD